MSVSLIDGDKLLERLPKVDFEHDVKISKSSAIIDFTMMVLDSDIVDAVPVVHGMWIRGDSGGCYLHECSVCRRGFHICEPNSDRTCSSDARNYCPNCGAKMDLEELR